MNNEPPARIHFTWSGLITIHSIIQTKLIRARNFSVEAGVSLGGCLVMESEKSIILQKGSV